MLSDRERAVLDIERRQWLTAGAKEAAALRAGFSPTRYYQVLNGLTARTDAWEYAPGAIARVIRIRDGVHERRRTGMRPAS